MILNDKGGDSYTQNYLLFSKFVLAVDLSDAVGTNIASSAFRPFIYLSHVRKPV